MMSNGALVSVRNLKKSFPVRGGFFSAVRGLAKAVDGVDLEILERETLALVGESGCGKSTLSRLIMGLLQPTEGSVTFMGNDVFDPDPERMKSRARQMQMVFQDVYASLNPRKTIRQILSQPYLIHEECARDEVDDRVVELLRTVEMTPADIYLDRFPHELSGGQKQRIAIARAIALRPHFIVADEPVSGLDMSVRAAVLQLMKRLRAEFKQSYLLVTHDLAIVRSVADRVAVMYLGKIIEQAPTRLLFEATLHPYTRALLTATPIPNPRAARTRKRLLLEGEVPSCVTLPSGCRFHPRCPWVNEVCRKEEPSLRECGLSHLVACHYPRGGS
jgi:oligopeptide transport system ATP-binding protein